MSLIQDINKLFINIISSIYSVINNIYNYFLQNKNILYINVSKLDIDLQRKYYIQSIEYNKNKTHRNSGFDLYTTETQILKDNDDITFDHNVSCAVYNNNKPQAYYLYPRSSISKRGIILKNSVGIIDSGYRGNLIAKCAVIKDNVMNSTFEKHERIFQVCAGNLQPFDKIIIVKTLDKTERGTNGFGSTGN